MRAISVECVFHEKNACVADDCVWCGHDDVCLLRLLQSRDGPHRILLLARFSESVRDLEALFLTKSFESNRDN